MAAAILAPPVIADEPRLMVNGDSPLIVIVNVEFAATEVAAPDPPTDCHPKIDPVQRDKPPPVAPADPERILTDPPL
jgi:hypothetical protein